MKQPLIFKLIKKTFSVICFLIITLMMTSACSKDDTVYAGTLSIEFTQWEPQWTGHLVILIYPLENEKVIIKRIEAKAHTINNIELNSGNYKILIRADNNDYTPYIINYVQIQVGKTENLKI